MSETDPGFIARYRCLKCSCEWSCAKPRPCPHCGHLYAKWLNFRG